MRRSIRPGLLGIFALLIGGCSTASDGLPKAPADVIGLDAERILSSADRVESFAIEPMQRATTAPATGPVQETVEGYTVVSKGKTGGAEFARRLNALLLDRNTYLWDSAKGCEPMPHVLLRAWSGKESASVVICFECDLLHVIAHADGKPSDARQWKDFDPGRGRLRALVNELIATGRNGDPGSQG